MCDTALVNNQFQFHYTYYIIFVCEVTNVCLFKHVIFLLRQKKREHQKIIKSLYTTLASIYCFFPCYMNSAFKTTSGTVKLGTHAELVLGQIT